MFKNQRTVGIIRDALYDAVKRHGNKRDVVRRGLCAYKYGSHHTKYNVHFVCSEVVEGIRVIQSVQRNAPA